MKRVQRIVRAASRPEPVGDAQEIFLEDRFQNIHRIKAGNCRIESELLHMNYDIDPLIA